MSRLWLCCSVALAVTGCRDLALPPPPSLPNVTGRAVQTEVGTGRTIPIPGASVQLVRTNLVAFSDSDGRFALGPLPNRNGGLLLLRTSPDSGAFLQRTIDLTKITPPVGDVQLGDVELGGAAFLQGTAHRADNNSASTGDLGIQVYVPEMPFATTTADNGAYVLSNLPPGPTSLAAFKTGYAPAGVSGLALEPGQLLSVGRLVLTPGSSAPARAHGSVLNRDGSPAAAATVQLLVPGSDPSAPGAVLASATTGSDGTYAVGSAPAGPCDALAQASGLTAARAYNLLLTPAEDADLGTLVLAPGQPPGPGGVPDAGSFDLKPVAVLRRAAVVPPGSIGQLDGTASYDPDLTGPLSYQWAVLPGPDGGVPATLAQPNAARTSFQAPAQSGTVFQVELLVSDGVLWSDPAVETLYVSPGALPPVVVAPSDQALDWTETALFDPSMSYDPQGKPLLFNWKLSAPCGQFSGLGPGGQSTDPRGLATYVAPAADCDTQVMVTAAVDGGLSSSAGFSVSVRDRQPPTVVSYGPTATSNSPAWGPVSVFFARPIAPSALDGGLSVTGPGGGISGALTLQGAGTDLQFIPDLPFPPGQALTAALHGIQSPSGLPLPAPLSFSFAAGAPALGPLSAAATTVGPGSLPIAAGGPPFWVSVSGLNDISDPTWFLNGTSWSFGSFVGAPLNARGIHQAAPGGRYVGGFAWFARPYNAGGCATVVARVRGGSSPSTFYMNSPFVPGTTYPASDCSATTWTSSAVDDGQIVWLGVADLLDGGAMAQPRLFQCSTCRNKVDGVDGPPAASEWVEMPPADVPTADALTGVSLDATGGPPVMVWVDATVAGPKLRGAQFDPLAGVWTALPGQNGPDLNASGTAALPTVHRAGADVILAYYHSEAGLTSLRVLRLRGGSWAQLGAPLDNGALVLDRIRLAVLGGDYWVGWNESLSATGGAFVKGYDAPSGQWLPPNGAASTGAVALDAGCSGDAPSLAPLPTGDGLMMFYMENCGANAGTLWERNVR